MEEFLFVSPLKNTDRQGQSSFEFGIQPVHDQTGNILVRDILHDGMLQCVRKWPVPRVMQQNGNRYRPGFLIRNIVPFSAQGFQRHAHQMRSEEHTSELQSLMRISYAV